MMDDESLKSSLNMQVLDLYKQGVSWESPQKPPGARRKMILGFLKNQSLFYQFESNLKPQNLAQYASPGLV